MNLTQTGLIDRILTVMEIQDSNLKYTPTDKEPLNKDLDGELYREDREYRSIVGMMLYIGSSAPTRHIV